MYPGDTREPTKATWLAAKGSPRHHSQRTHPQGGSTRRRRSRGLELRRDTRLTRDQDVEGVLGLGAVLWRVDAQEVLTTTTVLPENLLDRSRQVFQREVVPVRQVGQLASALAPLDPHDEGAP